MAIAETPLKEKPVGEMNNSDYFQMVYQKDIWEGGSGPGSKLEHVHPYLEWLQGFLREQGIQSVVDCGCGDWQSTRVLDLSGIDYLGIDLVPAVIEENVARFGSESVRFQAGDFTTMELPSADLIICKDALQHLWDADVFNFLRQIHKYRFALITNDLGENQCRNLILMESPFRYAPLDITRPPYTLAATGVWRGLGSKVTHLVEDTKQPIRWDFQCSPGGVTCPSSAPRVFMAILAKQKEPVLPFYLECLEALDYPKKAISLYIRTNNNTDRTAELLKEWVARVGHLYERVEMDDRDVEVRVEDFDVHEWNTPRFKVLGDIRQKSMQKAVEWGCPWYLVADTDNFLRPNTLKDLIALNLPIVSPLLRHVDPSQRYYSNYHYRADPNGYYLDCEEYYWVLQQRVRGILQVDVVHCTYLVKSEVIPQLRYDDGSGRHEYVIFSASARTQGIPQFLDNRQVYGLLTLDESPIVAQRLMGTEIEAALQQLQTL